MLRALASRRYRWSAALTELAAAGLFIAAAADVSWTLAKAVGAFALLVKSLELDLRHRQERHK